MNLFNNTIQSEVSVDTLSFVNATGVSVAIIPSASTTGTYTLTLPIDDGNSGQVLSTNGSGVTYWQTGVGGGSAVALATTGSDVVINTNAPTASGQVLVSTSTTNATWQVQSGGITASSTDTLTNKSLSDSSTRIVDDLDNTKKLKFELFNTGTGTTNTIATNTTIAQTYTLPDLSGNFVLDTPLQTLTNKQLTDSNTKFQNVSDNSKKMKFDLSTLGISQEVILTVPNDGDDTIATLAGTQTLTNKTLTNPVLKFADGTVSNPSISFTNETDCGLYLTGTPNEIGIASNGLNVATFKPDRFETKYRIDSLADGTLLHADGSAQMYRDSVTKNASLFTNGTPYQNVTTGVDNISIGYNQKSALTEGQGNVLIGNNVGESITKGGQNVGLGASALNMCTEGTGNCAIGTICLGALTTGSYNMAVGNFNQINATTSNANCSVGIGSLLSNVTGFANTALGAGSNQVSTSSDYLINIGSFSQPDVDGYVCSSAIGVNSIIRASNEIVLGGSANASLPPSDVGTTLQNTKPSTATTVIRSDASTGTVDLGTSSYKFKDIYLNGTIKNAGTLTLPTSTSTLATLALTETLTNKTFNNLTGFLNTGVVGGGTTVGHDPSDDDFYIRNNETLGGVYVNTFGNTRIGISTANTLIFSPDGTNSLLQTNASNTFAKNVVVTTGTVESDGIIIDGSTSGTIRLDASPTTTTHTLVLPASAPTTGQVLTSSSGATLSWATPGSGSFTPSSTDTLTNKTIVLPNGTISTPTLRFTDTDTGMYQVSTGAIAIVADSVERVVANTGWTELVAPNASSKLRVTNAGIVANIPIELTGLLMDGSTSGVLTINPSAITTSHTLTMPAIIPTAGQVLTSVSGGTLGWGTPSGVGEVNTSSNSGAGLGLAQTKVGSDLPFKSLTATSTKIGLTSNANDIGIDVLPANISILALSGAPVGAVVGISDSQTLTNKTLTTPVISTISNTGTITIPSTTSTLATLALTETLTNKTMTGTNNVLTASLLKNATTEVSLIGATAPLSGQVLMATSSTIASWQNVSVVAGTELFFNNNTASNIALNQQLSNVPDLGLESNIVIAVTNASDQMVQSFLTNVSYPNLISYPAGSWDFQIYSFASAGTTTSIYAKIYKVAFDNTSPALLATSALKLLPTAVALQIFSIVLGATVALTTDRIRIELWVNNTSVTSRNVTTYFDDIVRASYVNTPLAIGTGFSSEVATLTNKTLIDSTTIFQDDATASNKMKFELSGISGVTRTLTIPDNSGTISLIANTETLTNKTLTTPVISSISNTGTITLPTSTSTLATLALTETLTNKTFNNLATFQNTGVILGGTTVGHDPSDDDFYIRNNETLGGVYILTAGATRLGVSTANTLLFSPDGTNTLLQTNTSNTFAKNVVITTGTVEADGIIIDGSTSGTIRLDANATTTTHTLILPASAPTTGQVLTSSSGATLSWATPSASGEVNTSSNSGSGLGLAQTKVGSDLPFKSLTATSTKIGLTSNANDIGIDVLPANISILALSGAPSGAVVGISDTQTLTNKTLTGTNNVLTASVLKSATTEVSISSATAPSSGQVLTATSTTNATWQTPAGAGTSWTALQILNAKKSTFRGVYDSDNIGFLNTKMCSNGAGVALCISSASGNSLLTFDGCYLGAINPNTTSTTGVITGGTVGYHDIAYSSGNSIFVAISKTTPSRYSVGSVSATNAYGVSFASTVSFTTDKLWERIVYSPELNIFVVCNLTSTASTQNFMYSTTGASPTFTLCNAHTSGLFVSIQWCSNNAGGGFFYATGATSGASMTSTNGATWVNCTSATNTVASTCVVWDKVNQFGVIGYVTSNPIYKFTITNASTVVYTVATTVPTGGLTISDGCFCIGPSLFLLTSGTGSGTTCAVSSSDGLVWVGHYGFGWVNDTSRISYCEEYNSALLGSATASKYAVSSMIKPI